MFELVDQTNERWGVSMDREERIFGSLLGGAIGDALGAPVEFMSLDSIRREYGPEGIRDVDEAYGRVGAITDDTQMTLFTAEGLLRWLTAGEGVGSKDPKPFLYRAYLRWLETQGDEVPSHLRGDAGWLLGVEELHSRRAPGNTCLSALRSGEMGTPQRRLNNSKGCGGVMRAAPAGLVGAPDPFQLGVDAAAITHSHPSGYLSAGFLAQLIHEIVEGESLSDAVEIAFDRLESEPESAETATAVHQALRLAEEAESSAETVERLGEGWVGEEALAISLYCALVHPGDFEAAMILAVNHSGDTDSTGAITGNIVGTMLGLSGLPTRWLEGVELRQVVETMARDLAVRFRSVPQWSERYPTR